MKIATIIALAGPLLFASSCERRHSVPIVAAPPEKEEPVLYTTPGMSWEDSRFTSWMSRAELQYLQETNPADQFFARVEGRNNGGRMEYRAMVRPFPGEDYDQWAVFWGISEAELFVWELKLLKAGFIRDNMQICESPEKIALHQIVWLKPSRRGPGEEPSLSLTSADVIAGQSLKQPPAPQEELPVPLVPEATGKPDPVVSALPEVEVAKGPSKEAGTEPVDAAKPLPPKATPVPERKIIHTVKPGDTLGKIARQRGASVSDIRRANGLNNDIIRIGQKLEIPERSR